MAVRFPPSTILWLQKQDVLLAEENRFKRVWAEILREVQRRLSAEEWVSGSLGDLIQFYRDNWPNDQCAGVHYEVQCGDEFRRRGTAHVGLHIEQRLPKQVEVFARLRQLLLPYSPRLFKMMADCAPDMAAHWFAIGGTLGLADVTDDEISEALERMMQTESFVDEALFLTDKKTVWRTDFLAGNPKPYTKWHEGLGTGEEGGWEFSSDGGRLDSPCLKCDGRKSNYRDGKNIVMLSVGKPFNEFANGQRAYCSAVVHSAEGGQVQFYAQATKEGGWQEAFDAPVPLKRVDRWQLACWEGEISNPENYDFAKQGMNAFVMVKAPDPGLKIDAIEIGLC